jgi:hypothetical protein
MALIVAEKISKTYQVGEVAVQALKDVSFTIEPASHVRRVQLPARSPVPFEQTDHLYRGVLSERDRLDHRGDARFFLLREQGI